ncbi:MAG TPA: AAA family ATPase [Thermoanaerobaculia bacterium]|nr:AAA family ATPase [Thermoanaerobaculia bacterium]
MSTVVVLNGTSSAGKTTIARAFQHRAPSPFLNFSIDSILYTLPDVTAVPYMDLDTAYYACLGALVNVGRDVITDNAIVTREQAERLVAAVDGHRVLLVSVTAPAEMLAQREEARGDRRLGMAVRQLELIDRWIDYDLRIDTSVTSAEEGAQQIVDALSGATLKAFARTHAWLS